MNDNKNDNNLAYDDFHEGELWLVSVKLIRPPPVAVFW